MANLMLTECLRCVFSPKKTVLQEEVNTTARLQAWAEKFPGIFWKPDLKSASWGAWCVVQEKPQPTCYEANCLPFLKIAIQESLLVLNLIRFPGCCDFVPKRFDRPVAYWWHAKQCAINNHTQRHLQVDLSPQAISAIKQDLSMALSKRTTLL